MALFKPYRCLESQLDQLPITDGQVIFTTDTKEIYMDNEGERIGYSYMTGDEYFDLPKGEVNEIDPGEGMQVMPGDSIQYEYSQQIASEKYNYYRTIVIFKVRQPGSLAFKPSSKYEYSSMSEIILDFANPHSDISETVEAMTLGNPGLDRVAIDYYVLNFFQEQESGKSIYILDGRRIENPTYPGAGGIAETDPTAYYQFDDYYNLFTNYSEEHWESFIPEDEWLKEIFTKGYEIYKQRANRSGISAYAQPTEPESAKDGDIWFVTDK